MNKRKVISILVGTLLLFVWNAISWMVLPFHQNNLKNIPDKVFQSDIMKKEMPQSGVYHYPGLPITNSKDEISLIESKLKEEPRITLMVYKNEPTKLFNPQTFALSLLINLLTVFCTSYLISLIKSTNKKTIFFATLIVGVISVFISDISLMNWFMFPSNYTIVNAIDKIISFAILGVLFSTYTFKKQNYT